MVERLTDAIVRALPKPERGNRISYDTDVKGFGCRVTVAGARSFILSYRTAAGRERRYTIGQFPAWQTTAARKEAAELKKLVDRGGDPLAAFEEAREAPTVADLCERYEAEHLPKKRPSSASADRLMIAKYLPAALKHKRVADVSFSDVNDLHRKVTKAGMPIRANRVVALLGKMFSLAIRWDWRADNPAKGVELNPENRRERFLAGDELGRLTQALAEYPDQTAANVLRLLLLTGARRGEVLSARWDHFDLTAGVWTKPSSHTKQKKTHRVPLSGPARQLLADLYAAREPGAEFVFQVDGGRHRQHVRRAWGHVCKAAGLADLHVHDLRHSYAAILASSGLSLHVVGALLAAAFERAGLQLPQGFSHAQAVQHLLAIDRMFRENPAAAIQHMARAANVDLRRISGVGGHAPEMLQKLASQVTALQAENAELKRVQAEGLDRQRAAEKQRRAEQDRHVAEARRHSSLNQRSGMGGPPPKGSIRDSLERHASRLLGR